MVCCSVVLPVLWLPSRLVSWHGRPGGRRCKLQAGCGIPHHWQTVVAEITAQAFVSKCGRHSAVLWDNVAALKLLDGSTVAVWSPCKQLSPRFDLAQLPSCKHCTSWTYNAMTCNLLQMRDSMSLKQGARFGFEQHLFHSGSLFNNEFLQY